MEIEEGAIRRHGCYMLRPFAHPVACCSVLLGVVAQSLKPVKLLRQQLPTFLLFRVRRSVAQQCWIRLHSSSHEHCWGHERASQMVYKVLLVVSFPRCATVPNIFESCCIRWHTKARTDGQSAEQCWELLGPLHEAEK